MFYKYTHPRETMDTLEKICVRANENSEGKMPEDNNLYSVEPKHSIILEQLKHSSGIEASLSSFFRYPKL